MSEQQTSFTSFSEFYPYYLKEHSHPACRALHYTGTSLALLIWIYALWTGQYLLLLAGLVVGYGFAWTGHFFFEHNRPATFQYPLYSFMGDWVMLKDFLSGRFRDSYPG
ncbi:MAG: DUF962 domain-containing protein [Woeseiaceae bacterium]|nr:DUF962 domain-containing protein [Woeseiaceae bacterium]